jgi:type II secretory pathway component PulK
MIKRQDGIVLVAVLWICALIMWLALQIGAETRLQADERVHSLRHSQAMYLAVGGAYEAIARMGQPIPLDAEEAEVTNWQPDGKVHEVIYRTGKALVAVQRETDKVNINKASQEQIKAVLEKRGIEESEADALADVIADFLDPDDLPRLHGAEEDYYKNRELIQAPFNSTLTSIDQMLLIPGISQQLFFGFNPESQDVNGEDASTEAPLLSNKTSLFQMFTVYGNNLSLEDEEILEQAEAQYITWEPGETYRILSCGKLSSGSPPVVLWLIVRYAPDTEKGYEVFYRKIL